MLVAYGGVVHQISMVTKVCCFNSRRKKEREREREKERASERVRERERERWWLRAVRRKAICGGVKIDSEEDE